MRVGRLWILSRLAEIDRRVTLGLGLVVAGSIHTAAVLFFGVQGGMIIVGWLAVAGVAFAHLKLFALNFEHVVTTRQVQSLLYVLSVVKPVRPLPPMGGMAVSPDFAETLVSIVMESRPTTILEFGSGASTVLCGYCLKQLGAVW